MDVLGCKFFVILTNSFAGGLPLGILITSTESDEVLIEGFKTIKELLPAETSFGGRGLQGPQIFMTDNSAAERNGLEANFPNAIFLLCQFHILQAFWRYVWDSSNGVSADHKKDLYFYFKRMVHARSEHDFNNYHGLLYADQRFQSYPKVKDYVDKLMTRKDEWALYTRINLTTRGQNTNNLSEAAMKVITIYPLFFYYDLIRHACIMSFQFFGYRF